MKNLVFYLCGLLFTSCSSSTILLNSLNKTKAPLYYLHDTSKKDCDRTTTVSISEFSNNQLPPTTTVEKINRKIIPLIFYNYEEVNLGVKLGKSSLNQDYNNFFKYALNTESKRTGCFSLTDSVSSADFSLQIKYDTCFANSKYRMNSTTIFMLLFYGTTYEESGSPAYSKLRFSAELKRGEDVIFTKNYLADREQPFISNNYRDINKLRSDFLVNMAESLSLNTKDCIELLIQDINDNINN